MVDSTPADVVVVIIVFVMLKDTGVPLRMGVVLVSLFRLIFFSHPFPADSWGRS
jgi:hypothetical protein